MNSRAWLAILVLSLLWGGVFLYYELTLRGFEPFTVVLLRAGIGSIILIIVYILRRESWRVLIKHWRVLLILGIFNLGVPHVFFAWGQQYIDSGLASVLNATTPIPTLILATVIGQEKFNPIKLIGVFMGLLGVFVLFVESINIGGNQLLGSFAALVPAFLYAIGAVASRRYATDDMSLLGYATGMSLVATILVLPFSFAIEQPWQNLPTEIIPWIGAIAIGSIATALAYPLYYYLIRNVGATNTVLVTMLVPIIAIIAGVLILNERFGYTFFLGTVTILIALLLIDGRAYKFAIKKLKH